ncbi:hypothetical protein FRC07_007448, partial [Ceratobasidium sp. 392]
MPATDPADQQAERTIENAIREAVDRCERPPIELKWLWALPKRIRRSARLLEAAQSESQVLLKHIWADWTRVQVAEREREARLAQVKAQPRDLECLQAPDPAAWNGLGRRKKQCRAFDAVSKAYNTRWQVSQRAPAPSTAPVDVQTLQSTSRAPPSHPSTTLNPQRTFLSPSSTETSIPSPVATPPGLREAAESLRHQIRQKNPYSMPTESEVHSPNPYYVPELPSPPQCVMQSFDVQNPFFETGELLFPSFGCHINGLMLTVMSYEQVALAPWEKHHTLDNLAAWVLDAHREDPGGLDILLESLFPGGVLEFSSARVPTKAANLVVEDPYGNYVVQYILDLNDNRFSDAVIRQFVGNVCALLMQKFSSNVIEKCVRVAEHNTRKMLIEELLNCNCLEKLLRNLFGNYCVQTALDYAKPTQRMLLVEGICPILPLIRNTLYGKRIQSKLQHKQMETHHQQYGGHNFNQGHAALVNIAMNGNNLGM